MITPKPIQPVAVGEGMPEEQNVERGLLKPLQTSLPRRNLFNVVKASRISQGIFDHFQKIAILLSDENTNLPFHPTLSFRQSPMAETILWNTLLPRLAISKYLAHSFFVSSIAGFLV